MNKQLINYNPDVLDALANLSNDEVFTPPKLANQILDTLPQELWQDKNATFLDPSAKSGVFLREIAKRLIVGLKKEIPDLQSRLNHIYTHQLFGIGITELTSFLSRRSLYCSKKANGKYSVCTNFSDDEQGNIRFERVGHTWEREKCTFCGASQDEYERGESLETHAYLFIHKSPEEISNLFNKKSMQFDVIIGNPPYQLNTGSNSAQATPLYDKFVQQAKKINPRYLTMIIPGRWYAGGMGLDAFRQEMLSDKHIRTLVDYPNAGDCFPGVELRGGVCYFLWDRDKPGVCKYTNISGKDKNTIIRKMDEYPIFIRWNQAINIVNKVSKENEKKLSDIVSSVSPFGLATSVRGSSRKLKNSLVLHSSKGVEYILEDQVKTGLGLVGKYKVLISRPISGNLETPPFKVISLLKTLKPKEVCTHTYLVVGNYGDIETAQNLETYLKTRFVRFLLVQSISGIDISKDKFRFVPIQDFSESWTDEKLYKKYKLTQEEIAFIESMIRPMN
ncbi:MAG: restriction endonuclease [Candidatus Moranbacteria bacterium]|nr:restriction endonuclease [Candidatus Moranbacteria bacterium]